MVDGQFEKLDLKYLSHLQLQRLTVDSFFISRGYVTLSREELYNMEARYVGKLMIVLRTIEKIQAEKQEAKMKRR